MIKMIVCSDALGGIGANNDLIYNIKEDMKFFRETTSGSIVVMGYNTWLSLPRKPLPKRINYVLYDGEEDVVEESENVHLLRDIDEVLELGKENDIFIIGGAMLYNTMIDNDLIDEAYITIVSEVSFIADRFINIHKLTESLPNKELLNQIKYDDLDVYFYKCTKI